MQKNKSKHKTFFVPTVPIVRC